VEIAKEISLMNRKLEDEGRPYLLIGPGRWGSADHWLGIPVQWSDISGVGGMVEIRNAQLRADPSQGSHFFQNITSLGIPYFTVTENNGNNSSAEEGDAHADFIDWKFLFAIPVSEEGKYVRHIQLPQPFIMICNGKDSEGIILKRTENA